MIISGVALAMFEFLLVTPEICKRTLGRVSGLDTQFFSYVLPSRLKFENRQGDVTSIIITYNLLETGFGSVQIL